MKIPRNLNESYLFPCNITLGVFDGVHLGQQQLIKKLKEKNKDTVVITFSNHHLQILEQKKDLHFIYPARQKLKILESFGIDAAVLLEFTKELSRMPYINFLKILKKDFSFEHLIVGEDFSFGKNSLGNKISIKNLEMAYNFKLEIVKKIKYQKQNNIERPDSIFNKRKKLLNRTISEETKCQKNLQLISHAE